MTLWFNRDDERTGSRMRGIGNMTSTDKLRRRGHVRCNR